MRSETTLAKIRTFMARLGHAARGPGRVYFTGGVCAVLHAWRESTIDVDLKFDPEPAGGFEALPRLKDELDLNVELAAPDDFVPAVPGWRERSVPIGRFGSVEFFHFDFLSQALAKLERGHAQDEADVRAMLRSGRVGHDDLARAFEAIVPGLIRYPAIDPASFRKKVERFLAGERGP